jgi:hypothetical protein
MIVFKPRRGCPRSLGWWPRSHQANFITKPTVAGGPGPKKPISSQNRRCPRSLAFGDRGGTSPSPPSCIPNGTHPRSYAASGRRSPRPHVVSTFPHPCLYAPSAVTRQLKTDNRKPAPTPVTRRQSIRPAIPRTLKLLLYLCDRITQSSRHSPRASLLGPPHRSISTAESPSSRPARGGL